MTALILVMLTRWTHDDRCKMVILGCDVLVAYASCVFSYHIGSIAFGALVISVVQLIRSFLEYLSRRFKTCENDVAKFCLK